MRDHGRASPALVALVATLAVLPAFDVIAQRLIAVSSGDGPHYQEALAGLRAVGRPTDALQTRPDDPTLSEALSRLPHDAAIVTFGAPAAAQVAQVAPAVPIVNCMALDSDDGKVPPGTLVVPLDVPIDVRIQWLRRLLPDAHGAGILFDPAHNQRRAEESAVALQRAGYAPVLEPVSTPTELPKALSRLANRIDVLLAMSDTTVFAREHARALLLFSFRHQIPLAGPSEAWVRAGALYSVNWDYRDLGRYCASLALRQLTGGRAPPPAPARTRVAVNAHSAQQLRVKWDAELLRSVDQVYE
jgi:putative ABC transport system substrate-binding protein